MLLLHHYEEHRHCWWHRRFNRNWFTSRRVIAAVGVAGCRREIWVVISIFRDGAVGSQYRWWCRRNRWRYSLAMLGLFFCRKPERREAIETSAASSTAFVQQHTVQYSTSAPPLSLLNEDPRPRWRVAGLDLSPPWPPCVGGSGGAGMETATGCTHLAHCSMQAWSHLTPVL